MPRPFGGAQLAGSGDHRCAMRGPTGSLFSMKPGVGVANRELLSRQDVMRRFPKSVIGV